MTISNLNTPFPIRRITVLDDIEIAYVDEGAGPHTLVMLHGLGSYHQAWTKMIAGLRSNYRCIALDLPGYGQSSQGNYSFTMRFFACTVQAFLGALRLEQVVLVGHSMGGQIALTLAHDDPSRLGRLVLVAPAGFETFTRRDRHWLEGLYRPAVLLNLPEAQIVRDFELNFFRFPEDARFMIEDRLAMRQTAAYQRFCHMAPRCMTGMLREPVYDKLPRIDLPTLIVFGREDQLIPHRYLHPHLTTAAVAQAGLLAMPRAELVLLETCGHFPQWEKAKKVNATVREFLG